MGQSDHGMLAMQESPQDNVSSNGMKGGMDMRSDNMEENSDTFPVGMRVLVVDDDHVCLYLVEKLMRRCQYKVTTCQEAVTALEMLRENKDRFDLVISDVNMPDMDGFKLLELVELEMDLPVIMMSIDGETNKVMRGIKHGACDYLLKPVRLEELKNIWQHVVRKKNTGSKDLRHGDENEKSKPGGDGEHGSSDNDDGTDRNSKLNRKRKDPNDNDDEDDDNEDPSTLKKPRVVWSIELHQQFVHAVNKLGIDKAVPKRILEYMNVTGLTRENVASHLQKYRLYLKRLSSVGNTFGAREAAFGSLASMDGIDDFHALMQSGQFSASPLASLNAGVLGRADTGSVSLSIPGLNSSAMLPYSSSLQGSSSSNRQQRLMQPLNESHLLSGLPTGLEDHQQQDQISRMGDIGAAMDDPARFQGITPTDVLPLTIGGDNMITRRTLVKELYSGLGPSSRVPSVNEQWGNSSPLLGLPTNTKAVLARPSTSMQNLRESRVINRPVDVRHELGSQFISKTFPERDVADHGCSENIKYFKAMDVSLAGPSCLSAINNNMRNMRDTVAIDNIRSKYSIVGRANAGLGLVCDRNQLQNQEWMITNQGVGSNSSNPVLGPQFTPTCVRNQKFLGGQGAQAKWQNITGFGDQITNTCIKPPAVNAIVPVFGGNCENELEHTAESQTKLREDYLREHGKAVDVFMPVNIKKDQIELEEIIRRLKQGGRGVVFPNGSTIGDGFPRN